MVCACYKACVLNRPQVPKRPDIESLVAACRRTAVQQRSSRIQCAARLCARHKYVHAY